MTTYTYVSLYPYTTANAYGAEREMSASACTRSVAGLLGEPGLADCTLFMGADPVGVRGPDTPQKLRCGVFYSSDPHEMCDKIYTSSRFVSL